MTWFIFDTNAVRSAVWRSAVQDLAPHGGIGHAEFINFDTGAAMLVAADGEWRTGGRFRIFYRCPVGEMTEVRDHLWRLKDAARYPLGSDSTAWSDAKSSVISGLTELLAARKAWEGGSD